MSFIRNGARAGAGGPYPSRRVYAGTLVVLAGALSGFFLHAASAGSAELSQNLAANPQIVAESVEKPRPERGQGKQQYPADQYMRAIGEGDLAKGHLICKRVSETLARAELGRQIRVTIKEELTHKISETEGKVSQDVSIITQEKTNELLRDSEIVAYSEDPSAGKCSSTVVMPKSRILEVLSDTPVPSR